MATLKKSARKKTASASSNETLQAQAEQLSKRLGESAQQVWLAGVGAFGRAQAEGTKLFETLVKEGLSLEQITRKTAGGKAQAMRDAVESTVGQARERASDTWDRLEKVFEERVHRALRRCPERRAAQAGRRAGREAGTGAQGRRQETVAGSEEDARQACIAQEGRTIRLHRLFPALS